MRTLAVVVAMAAMLSVSAAKDELQVSDLVKKNLESIGTDSARAAAKSRVTQGPVRLTYLTGGAGTLDGKQVLASEGSKMVVLLKLLNPKYHGEPFVSDGQRTSVAQVSPGIYSPFGEFVMVHDEILKEGLLGGTLSTSWALAHLDERHANLRYEGLKKIGGVELHCVDYAPARHSDLEIKLYFEPGTFRHVLTTYSMTISPKIATTDDQTARQRPAYYQLEERFGDFKQTDGLQLPSRWVLRFSKDDPPFATNPGGSPPEVAANNGPRSLGGGHLTRSPLSAPQVYTIQFDTIDTEVSHTQTLDPKNFEVK
jgi:hypothetical protein